MNAIAVDIPYRRLLSPAILLFGDDGARRAELAAMIAQAGGRVVAHAPIEHAAARIAGQSCIGGIVIDVRTDDGTALDAALARIDAWATLAARPFGVVIVPAALIDIATARIGGAGVDVLVEPDDAEIAAALAALVAPPKPWLAEGGEASSRRLAQLSEEVGRIARTLASLSGDEAPRAPVPSVVNGEDAPMLRAFLRLRRLRGQHFAPGLFADPAWDILLDLALARIEGRMVAVSSLCIAAAVPATTALRWITHMTEQALLVRQPDPTDGRRIFIALAEASAAAMEAYLAQARKIMAPAG